MELPNFASKQPLRWWIIGGVVCALLVWIAFFDSHSLLRRFQWHQEHEQLTEENRELRLKVEQLREQLDRPLSDSMVERIAREEYGMKRPGETVYRLKKEE